MSQKSETQRLHQRTELPDTLFVRDIDNRVFQHLVAQALSRVPDIAWSKGDSCTTSSVEAMRKA